MWTYLIGPFLSLLPRQWRAAVSEEREIHWTRAAFISGTVIGGGCLLGLIAWYLHFIQVAAAEQAGVALEALSQREPPKGLTGAGASYAMGLASLVSFFMQPLTWVLAYFAVEGIWRALAAAITEEAPASLPLVLAAKVYSAVERREYEYRVPLVADMVTRSLDEIRTWQANDPWDLRVASCRPKPDWIPPLTVRYQNEFFKVVGSSQAGATPARPHVYLLKRVPENEALRGVRNYSPEDLLHRAEEKPSGLGGAFAEWKERRRIARLPRVADRVTRGDGKQDWDLKIESCWPKPPWTPGRTIQFEGVFYSVAQSTSGSPERPFGFLLKRVPPNEAVRGPITYDPEEALH
jgi:hypothetical protein